jgi:hypothetical protein
MKVTLAEDRFASIICDPSTGNYLVYVRELNDRGTKGLAMNQSQWGVLTLLLPHLHEEACLLQMEAEN